MYVCGSTSDTLWVCFWTPCFRNNCKLAPGVLMSNEISTLTFQILAKILILKTLGVCLGNWCCKEVTMEKQLLICNRDQWHYCDDAYKDKFKNQWFHYCSSVHHTNNLNTGKAYFGFKEKPEKSGNVCAQTSWDTPVSALNDITTLWIKNFT